MSQQNVSCRQGLELSMIASKAIINAIKKCDPSSKMIQEIIEKPGEIFQFYEEIFRTNLNTSSILSLVSTKETLVLEALPGGDTSIARAKGTFWRLDPDFKKWGLGNNQKETEETVINIYEIVKDANYFQMFKSLNSDLDKLCLTQSQIVRFCHKYPSYLRHNGCDTFFLFKENKQYYVAYVIVISDGLDIDVYCIKDSYFWNAEYRHRLVIPATKL